MTVTSHIIIATDFTDASQHAIEWAAGRVLKAGDHVVLLHTILPSSPPADIEQTGVFIDSDEINQRQIEAAEAESQEFLQKVKASVFTDSKITVDVAIEVGDPGTIICGRAAALPASLVVVGTHSKSNWQTLLMGSVSNYVLHHCESPVIIVRT